MADKFQNKYRIGTTRLKYWDYGWNGFYFVTICTKNRICFFGDIVDGKMQLTEIGKMAEKYWVEIPDHFPFVKLDAFVVMPNHIHGIIEIAKIDDGYDRERNSENDVRHNVSRSRFHTVETQDFASLQPEQPTEQPEQPIKPIPSKQSKPETASKNKFGTQSKNLASIIRGYKTGVTQYVQKINNDWAWQSRYYDHIIRNEKSLKNIRNYIVNNPVNWKGDGFYKT